MEKLNSRIIKDSKTLSLQLKVQKRNVALRNITRERSLYLKETFLYLSFKSIFRLKFHANLI